MLIVSHRWRWWRVTRTHVVMPARISVWGLVSDDERNKKLKSAHEEARTLSLVRDVGPLKLKPTPDERIGHLCETINNPEIVTRKVGVRRR